MDYEDLNLRQTSHEDSPIILSVPLENSHDRLKIAGAVLLVIAVAATGYLLFRIARSPRRQAHPLQYQPLPQPMSPRGSALTVPPSICRRSTRATMWCAAW
jgi:hypothetical protein